MEGHADLEAAKDYWRQILERLSSAHNATIVERDEVLAHAVSGEPLRIAEAYGMGRDAADGVFEKYVQSLTNAPITSPGVDPHAEWILDDLCRRIEAACRKAPGLDVAGVARGIEPRLGVFASRMGVIMTDASVVTVGSQVFRFANVVAKAITRTIMVDPAGWDDPGGLEAMRVKLRRRPEILAYWFRIIASFSILGTSVAVPLWLPGRRDFVLRAHVLDALEVFVVAHEYAHHILRHGRMTAASSESGKDRSSRAEEHEADHLAIMIGQLETGHQPYENPVILSGAGMVVFLHALQMLEETRRMLGKPAPTVDDGTHPSVAERLDFIEGRAELWPVAAEPLRNMRHAYKRMMQAVWEEVRPFLEELSHNGRQAELLW